MGPLSPTLFYKQAAEAKSEVPDWGDILVSGIGP